MRKLSTVMAAGLVFATAPALAADIYKCYATDGKVEFRDRPCDGAVVGQKLKAKDNSIGTGDDIASIRTRSAELKARMAARQDAEDKARAEAYAAQEKAFLQERAHQDSVNLADAIRGKANTPFLLPPREQRVRVEIVTRPTPAPAKAIPR